MAIQSQTRKSFYSMSGVDLRCIINNKPFAELQGLDITVKREIAPIYTWGSANVRAWSRGKRAIAGSMTVAFFDRYSLDEIMRSSRFSADKDEIRFNNQNDGSAAPGSQNSRGASIRLQESVFNAADILNPGNDQDENATPWYADQIPEFQINILGANEAYSRSSMVIIGCQFVSEGIGMSIDDTMLGYQFQFVARDVGHFRPHGEGANEIQRQLTA